MADLVTDPTVYANQVALASDIRGAEANIRDKVGAEACLINKNIGDSAQRLEKGLGDNRYTIAAEAGSIRQQIGAEACAINKHIGDTRQEDAENFGHTRRDIAASGSDIRYDLATRAGDIRREGAEHTNEIVKEGIKSEAAVRSDIKDARYDLYSQIDRGNDYTNDHIENAKDNIMERTWALGRDTMDLRAQVTALGITVRDNAQLSALQTEKAVLASTIEGQKNTQYLNDKIVREGEATRALINDLKYHDLNRGLVERNTELVNCEQDRRFLRDRWDDARWGQWQTGIQGQFAQLQSQVQAFQSQLSTATNGMVNFGTMAGVGQSSTNNQVR